MLIYFGSQVRCEGSQPTCKTCEVYHDDCRYDKAPPMSQVLAMAKRLQDAERTINELRRESTPTSQAAEISLPVDSSPVRSPVERSPPAAGPNLAEDVPESNVEVHPRNPVTSSVQNFRENNTVLSSEPVQTHLTISIQPEDQVTTDLSVDEHGKICYYGPTSAVHNPPELTTPASLSSTCDSFSSMMSARSFLSSYSKESSMWETYALGNIAGETGIPRPTLAKLLQIHWTWVSPMFMWVYRPAFTRK